MCHSFLLHSSSAIMNSHFKKKEKQNKTKFIHNKSLWMSNALRQPLQLAMKFIFRCILFFTHYLALSLSLCLFICFSTKKNCSLSWIMIVEIIIFMMCVDFSLANECVYVCTAHAPHERTLILYLGFCQNQFFLVFVTLFYFRSFACLLAHILVCSFNV